MREALGSADLDDGAVCAFALTGFSACYKKLWRGLQCGKLAVYLCGSFDSMEGVVGSVFRQGYDKV